MANNIGGRWADSCRRPGVRRHRHHRAGLVAGTLRVLHTTAAAQSGALRAGRRRRHHPGAGRRHRRAHRPARPGGVSPARWPRNCAAAPPSPWCTSPEAKPAATGLESTMRFILRPSPPTSTVRVFHVGAADATRPADWDRPLAGKVAIVTGAAAGSARRSPRCSPATAPRWWRSTSSRPMTHSVRPRPGSAAPRCHWTSPPRTRWTRSPNTCASSWDGRADVLVNNAGITRDKLLANMDDARWDAVLAVNLLAPQRLTEGLVGNGSIGEGGRIVGCPRWPASPETGPDQLRHHQGQDDRHHQALAPVLAEKGITINAVAPGSSRPR